MSDAAQRAGTHAVYAAVIQRELPGHADKLEALEAMESLFEHPGWVLVERLARKKAQALVEMMDAGAAGVRPYPDYIAHHAERFGIRTVLDIPTTVRVIARESIENAQAGERE